RHEAFVAAEHFCIHILGEDQHAEANHFATQGHDFSALDWTPGPTGAPQLFGCLATFHCARFAVHEAGDHSVILGQVMHAAASPGEGAGLLFDQGRFGRFVAQDAG
ncbi:MAG: flavin reductase family protein, partial [Pseudomonadota bacterium]